jgi:hypothetical protein
LTRASSILAKRASTGDARLKDNAKQASWSSGDPPYKLPLW